MVIVVFSLMKKQVIAIDIDDTILDSTGFIRSKTNQLTGKQLSEDAYKVEGDYWGYYERVWIAHEIDKVMDMGKIHEYMLKNHLEVPLLPGAEFAILQLMKKYKIVLITSRELSFEAVTKKWLKRQFGDSYPEVYFSQGHKSTKHKNKGQICKDIGASWLIDDNVQHCKDATKENIKAILYGEYGWQYQADDSLYRCKDWQSVLEYFQNA